MQCNEFESRIQELLDQRQCPEADGSLVRHAEHCRPCAQTLARQELLFTALELFEPPPMSDGFTDRVMAGLTVSQVTQRPGRASGQSRDVFVAIAMVAALLLVALIPIVQHTQPAIQATTAKDEDTGERQSPDAPQSDKRKATTSQPVTAIIDTNHAEVQQIDPEWSPLMLLSGVEIPDVSFRSDDIPGVRPFTNSVNVAITLIRQTLAGGKSRPSQNPPATSQRGMELGIVS